MAECGSPWGVLRSPEVLFPVNVFYLNPRFCASSSQLHSQSRKEVVEGREGAVSGLGQSWAEGTKLGSAIPKP